MGRERELKYDLGGEEAARRLEARLGRPESARWQVSRFFDTPVGHLRRELLALRLRGEWPLPVTAPPVPEELPPGPPARVVLSLKGARRGGGAFHDRSELQAVLGTEAWGGAELAIDNLPVDWRGTLAPALNGSGRAAGRAGADGAADAPEASRIALVEFTRLVNLRRTYPLPPGWQAEVDRTRFASGGLAWEVEIELAEEEDPEPVRRLIENLLRACAIAPRAQERSKLERALAGPRP